MSSTTPIQSGSSPTERQVRAQLAAMHAASFELLLLDFADDSKAQLITTNTEGILRRLAWLRARNSQGANVNIRPTTSHLSLLDDLTLERTQQLTNEGYEPCAVVETSPGNFQAWLDHGRELQPGEATMAAKLLADRFGCDMGAAGRRHAGRLAGFTNRKLSRQLPNGLFPFVRLTFSESRSYSQRDSFLQSVADKVESERRAAIVPFPIRIPRSLLSIERFHSDPRYGGDLSRADYAYAIYAHSHGVSASNIEAAILQRDMSKKGNAIVQRRYARYTVRRARNAVK